MGITKTEGYESVILKMSNLLKALAHPTRLQIVMHLAKSPKCICGDLVEVLPLSQSTVSRHLSELKNAGFIIGNTEGNSICYCLNNETMQLLRDFVNQIQLTNSDKLCC